MKRIIIYTLLIILFTVLGFYGLNNQPKDLPEESILNKELYKYNISSGEYETLKITKRKVEYNGTSLDLKNCSDYSYNNKTGIIKLDCGKAFRIIGIINNFVAIKINNENIYLYFKKEDSYNGEFQRYFQTTKENYIEVGKTKIEPIKIDYNKLLEVLSSNTKSYIYIKNNNCNDICNIYNNIFGHNELNNRYYIESNTLTEENIIGLNSINASFKEILNSNTKYPIVLEVQNNNILRNIEVKVNGLDFNVYTNLERNEVSNEEINE